MLPEHLKIGYEIVRVSTGTADFELQGEFDADEARIIVAAKGSPRRRMATLMHEILHACWDQAEMSDLADHDKEEQIVNRLASVLTAVLLDNPQLRQAIETAAQNGNSTCWRDVEPRPFTAREIEDAVAVACKNLRERIANGYLCKPDNERRNEQKAVCPATGYKCLTPQACKSLNVCCQLGI